MLQNTPLVPKSEVFMKQESTVDLLLDVDQRPSAGKGILLSFQHVFAMFGATILVPYFGNACSRLVSLILVLELFYS